jgi:hypothetical protein
MTYSLNDFLKSFVAEHTLYSGDDLVLDVTPEDIQALGDFFVRGICGWVLGLKTERQSRRLVEVTETIEFPESTEGIGERSSEGNEGHKDPIN